ncbi:hypothetical protein, partial [Tepidiforma sp.]|uniref:hypothetical protein n=1 Tax=Tepidiforma sp. TaxID=2682230 RepID=UPI002ADD448B
MESYKLLLFLHLGGVMVGLGATFAFPLLQAMTEAQGVAATRLGLHITHRIENLVVNPAVVVLFL